MKLIITLLLFISTLISFGQDFKIFEYEINLGTNISIPYKWTIETMPNFEGHPETDYRPGIGYFFEFITSYHLNTRASLYSGLNLNGTLLHIHDKLGLLESIGKIKTTYISVPILINYRFSDNSPFSFSLGPYFGFIISAREIGTTTFDTAGFIIDDDSDPIIDSIDPIQDYDNDIKKNFRSLDFGVSAQYDYEFEISDSFLGVIFTRFNYGLLNVITNDIYTKGTADKWKNYNLVLGVGLKF
jgi:hypothetical protein